MKKLSRVTAHGIDYYDENGTPQFVDFETCYQNFLTSRATQMGSRYSDELIEHDKTWRSVGFRKSSANPPYVEFFTVPPTRFEFPTIGGKFEELVYEVRKAGWITIDGD